MLLPLIIEAAGALLSIAADRAKGAVDDLQANALANSILEVLLSKLDDQQLSDRQRLAANTSDQP